MAVRALRGRHGGAGLSVSAALQLFPRVRSAGGKSPLRHRPFFSLFCLSDAVGNALRLADHTGPLGHGGPNQSAGLEPPPPVLLWGLAGAALLVPGHRGLPGAGRVVLPLLLAPAASLGNLGSGCGHVPWILWMSLGLGAWQRDPIAGYYTDYLGWWSSTGPVLLGKMAAGNLVGIIWSIADLSLEGLDHWISGVALWPILATLLGLISLVSILGRLGQGQVLPYYLLFFLMAVWLWPWSPSRLLVPVLPFVIAYLLAGIRTLCRHLPEKLWFRRLTAGMVSVLVLANLTLLYQHRAIFQRTGYPYPYAALLSPPPSWPQYQDLFDWIKANIRPGDALASWEDPMLYLYTGRISIRPLKSTPAPRLLYGEAAPSFGKVEDLRRTLRAYKVRYLVKMPAYGYYGKDIDRLLDGLQQRYPDWVKPVYVGPDRRFAVLALSQEN